MKIFALYVVVIIGDILNGHMMKLVHVILFHTRNIPIQIQNQISLQCATCL